MTVGKSHQIFSASKRILPVNLGKKAVFACLATDVKASL